MLRTRIKYSGMVTGPSVTTMYWAATEDSSGVTAVRSALSTWLTAAKVYIATVVTVTLDPVVDVLSSEGQLTGLLSASALSVTGTDAGAHMAPTTQWVIQWRTGAYVTSNVPGKTPRSHEVRGRSFLPGATANGATSGKPSTTAVAALTTASQTLANDSAASLVIWSPTHSVGYGVDVATCWDKFGVLRSRRD